ncbi:hypothetical protein QT970_02490 [Microcoleus sp. herbarium8]
MGQGNKLIVSATGFPGTNKTLRFIQDAFSEPLGALAKLAGDKTIITGVVVANSVPIRVTSGFISYNGEIIPFVGGEIAATVTIIETFENVNYNTDANDDTVLDSLPAYRTIYARCGTGGIDIFNFSELTRLKTIKELSDFRLPSNIVIDPNYVATEVSFTLALLQKLNSIETGAEVNVQADWNVVNPASDAFIKNKPSNWLTVLRRGANHIGDIRWDDELKTVFFPSVGTTNYTVLCTVVSYMVANWNRDNDFSYVICNKTATSFQMGFREYSPNPQSLKVEYVLIQN